MGKKMYYNEQEAADRLHISTEELAKYVRDNKVRVFPDGPRKMYKVDEVDKLAGPAEDEIQLSPAGGDTISIKDTEPARPAGKEDTVITAEGISIFDDEDLELEAADPMAKTQIAPSLEDQVAMEGVGSGSGLLDLTRERDDTSLGAEVLGHIDTDSTIGSESPASETGSGGAAVQQVVVEPTIVQAPDPTAGLFGGIAAALMLVSMLIGAMGLAVVASKPDIPGLIKMIYENITTIVGVGAGMVIVFGGIGFALGKANAKQQAMRRATA